MIKEKINEIDNEIQDISNAIREKTGDRLPVEYQEVDYLQSTGGQYIETNYFPNQNTKAEIKGNQIIQGDNSIFGSNPFFVITSSNGKYRFRLNGNVIDTNIQSDELVKIVLDKTKAYINDNLMGTFAQSTFTSNYSAIIFGRRSSTGTIEEDKASKIYYLKLYDNDFLIRDYVPCYRKSDNKPGMYDLVNKEFCTNQGTGEFIKGNDVTSKFKLSEMPQAILDIPKGIDTSDATAVSDDILLGKTAYARGMQVVGTYEPSGGKTYTGHADVEGLKQIGWTDEDIQYLQDNVWWNEEDDNLYKLSDEEKSGVVNPYKTRFLPKNSGKNNFNSYYALNTIPKIAGSTNMSNMFYYCSALQKIPELDTSNVTNMANMFQGCYALQKIPELDTGNVTNMSNMFNYCRSLQEIPELDTGNVTTMANMFQSCYSLQEIQKLDTGNVNNMSNMFNNCSALRKIPKLDTSNVTNMSNMFNYCYALQKIPELDTGNVTNMANMFYYCASLQEIPELDTGNVTNMANMFQGCSALQEIPKLDTSNVTTMVSTFYYCHALQEIPELDTGNVTTMASMCYGCSALQKIPKLDTSSVTYMNGTFTSCSNLIDLGGFQNLGKAYLTTQSANYSTYTLTLSVSTKITHDSLINVINNLYDIATKGCKSQRLILGTANLDKISDEEKAIATTKGWTLS